MKNKIIIIILLFVVLLTGCNNKNRILKISNLEKYKNINIKDIKTIEIEYITLIGNKIVINEQNKIHDIYKSLGNIELVKISNKRTLDAGMKITIITDNKNESYYFELDNYEYDNNTQYETKNLDKLKELIKDVSNSKIKLKLQQFDLSLEQTNEDIEYEKSMVMKHENINISGIKFKNIENGMLSQYKDKYSKLTEYIKSKYSNFDIDKWNIMVNMYSINDGNGIIRLNYQIKNIIDTNKSILFTINNNVINRVTFINMEFDTNEDELVRLVNDFKNNTIQEKKVFNENEEFLKEEVNYSYRYNTDELVYTYQLYFYQQYGDSKVINNEYGTEYVINKSKETKKL